MPQRIQRKRTKGYRLPENAVSITRPGRWGNPFKVGSVVAESPSHYPRVLGIADVLEWYEKWLRVQIKRQPDFLEPLRGKDLACFCKEGAPCHGDVLLRMANT